VKLPSEVHAWLDRLREGGILFPPLRPPDCCERCQRPLEPERQRYPTCYDCGRVHGRDLAGVSAATYAAVGTPPWELLLDAKFERVASDAVAQRVTAIAAAVWETIETMAPDFLEGSEGVAVTIPSSRDLIHRCAAEATQRGWGSPAFEDRLRAEDRPRQSDLSAADRREAARNKYAFDGDLTGKGVLLLDDVYTSGYTMHDAARACRAAGATSVVGVVYARRVFPDVMALYRELRDV